MLEGTFERSTQKRILEIVMDKITKRKRELNEVVSFSDLHFN